MDDDVEAAITIEREVDHAPAAFLGGEILMTRCCACADLSSDAIGERGIEALAVGFDAGVMNDDSRTTRTERARVRGPQPAPAARHEDDLVVKSDLVHALAFVTTVQQASRTKEH
jgi:hypothetical protein